MQTVVLNADFSYLNTVNWKKAVKLIIKEKAEVLVDSDKRITDEISVPLILRLVNLVKAVYKNKVPYTKKNIFIRDRHCCQYCGKRDFLTIDHVLPESQGGKSEYTNCVTACFPCNNMKGNRTPEQAGMKLRKAPYEPTVMDFLMLKMKSLGVDKTLKELGVF
jgi:5-methylcytosine-specific restriction endonuclease McrA